MLRQFRNWDEVLYRDPKQAAKRDNLTLESYIYRRYYQYPMEAYRFGKKWSMKPYHDYEGDDVVKIWSSFVADKHHLQRTVGVWQMVDGKPVVENYISYWSRKKVDYRGLITVKVQQYTWWVVQRVVLEDKKNHIALTYWATAYRPFRGKIKTRKLEFYREKLKPSNLVKAPFILVDKYHKLNNIKEAI